MEMFITPQKDQDVKLKAWVKENRKTGMPFLQGILTYKGKQLNVIGGFTGNPDNKKADIVWRTNFSYYEKKSENPPFKCRLASQFQNGKLSNSCQFEDNSKISFYCNFDPGLSSFLYKNGFDREKNKTIPSITAQCLQADNPKPVISMMGKYGDKISLFAQKTKSGKPFLTGTYSREKGDDAPVSITGAFSVLDKNAENYKETYPDIHVFAEHQGQSRHFGSVWVNDNGTANFKGGYDLKMRGGVDPIYFARSVFDLESFLSASNPNETKSPKI